MTRKYSFWSDEEKRKLVELYPHYSLIELQVIFKRSGGSISRMAISLGARKYKRENVWCDYDVYIKFTNIHYTIYSNHKNKAKQQAINLLTSSLRKRKNITDLICLSQSTVTKIKTHGNYEHDTRPID